ncbi:hypothetical protein GCM10022251_62710 [Phytohabitans flavus]|uniref:Uncharacterized protein n=1 Tax=Phytohabitans flavus TaxID=1076124 RepID=A0A6F8Y5H8_9ACTN|nr:hypothetical protein Pflav_076480 [Phytohabitans flavus]
MTGDVMETALLDDPPVPVDKEDGEPVPQIPPGQFAIDLERFGPQYVPTPNDPQVLVSDGPTGRRADGPTGRRADGPTGRRARSWSTLAMSVASCSIQTAAAATAVAGSMASMVRISCAATAAARSRPSSRTAG